MPRTGQILFYLFIYLFPSWADFALIDLGGEGSEREKGTMEAVFFVLFCLLGCLIRIDFDILVQLRFESRMKGGP